MALSIEELQEMAALAQELGDVDAELEAREGIEAYQQAQAQAEREAQTQEAPQEEQSFISAAADTAGFLGQSAGAQIGAGWAGILTGGVTKARNELAESLREAGMGDAADFIEADSSAADAANRAVQSTLEYLSPELPESERSQAQLQDIGGAVEYATEKIQKPLSGIAGLAEGGYQLAQGESLEDAAKAAGQTVEDVQDKGLSGTMGDRVLEETGSPEAAAIAYASPEAALELIGLKGAGAGLKASRQPLQAASQAAKQGAKEGVDVAKRVGKTAKDVVETIPTKRRAAAVDDYINRFNKKADDAAPTTPEPKLSKRKAQIREDIAKGDKDAAGWKIDEKSGKVVKDPKQQAALTQGFDPRTVATAAHLSKSDKKAAHRMFKMAERSLKNPVEGARARPQQVIGDRVLTRFKIASQANKQASKDIGEAVKTIRNERFDITNVIDEFDDALDNLNVPRSEKGALVFKGSQLDGNKVNPIIKRIDDRLKPDMSAKEIHDLKQYIDRQIYTGSKDIANPLDQQAVTALKAVRGKINKRLEDVSDAYRDGNRRFAETREAQNALKDVMGKRVQKDIDDIDWDSVDFDAVEDLASLNQKVGQEMRKTLSNYGVSRDMIDAIDQMDDIARKYNGKYGSAVNLDDDPVALSVIYSAMEREFGSFAENSLQSVTEKAASRLTKIGTGQETGLGVVGDVVDVAKNLRTSEAKALKAFDNLLKE